jgi:hypothetical protein
MSFEEFARYWEQNSDPLSWAYNYLIAGSGEDEVGRTREICGKSFRIFENPRGLRLGQVDLILSLDHPALCPGYDCAVWRVECCGEGSASGGDG